MQYLESSIQQKISEIFIIFPLKVQKAHNGPQGVMQRGLDYFFDLHSYKCQK